MSAAYTTRAEAEAHPAHLVETMARAAYDATRTNSFPTWEAVTAGYRSDMHKSIRAAITAAEAAGYTITQEQSR